MSQPTPKEVTQYERDTWNRCADSYLDTFAGLTSETVPLLIKAARIQSGSHVLEIGSGPGHVAGALARAGAVVTGIDFAGDMVKVAQRHFPGITFREADAEQIPFDEAHFDAVVSNFVVHHLARPALVFNEVLRVLKPGGTFAFIVFARPKAQSSIAAFFEAVAAHHDPGELPHGPLFGADRSDYQESLSASGLGDLRFETHDVCWRSPTIEPILQALMTWGNITALSKGVQARIEGAARDNMDVYRDGAGYLFPHAILLGIAKKPVLL